MKHKIILFIFMVLASVITFGQNTVKNQIGKCYRNAYLNEKKAERRVRALNSRKKQKSVLKSANMDKQQLDHIIDEVWNSETSQWENDSKSEYTYDANGNLTGEISSEWNSETSQWENSSILEYTYGADGNLTNKISNEWNSETSQWGNPQKIEYSYNANENLTTAIYYNRNIESSQWENSSIKEYTYDANGNLTDEISSVWNSETSQWENNFKLEYSYNGNENLTASIYYNTNIETSQWENLFKTEYTYDANGNLTDEIGSDWNSETGQWINEFKEEYTYDLSYDFNDLVFPDFDNIVFFNKLVDMKSYEFAEESWSLYHKATLYYTTVIPTSISGVNKKDNRIYPNPVLENVNFNITSSNNTFKFELYTSQGHKLISKQITNNESLSLEGLAKGIYLYNLNVDGEILSGKLIKE